MPSHDIASRIRGKYNDIHSEKSKKKTKKKKPKIISNKYKTGGKKKKSVGKRKNKKEKNKCYATITIEKRLCAKCIKKPDDFLPAMITIPWIKCSKCNGIKYWFRGFSEDEKPYIIDVTLKSGEVISIVRNRKAYKQVKREHPGRVCYALGELPDVARITMKSRKRIHEIKKIFGGGVIKVKKIGKCKECFGQVCKEDLTDGKCSECI